MSIRLSIWNGVIFGPHICLEHHSILIWTLTAKIQMIRLILYHFASLHAVSFRSVFSRFLFNRPVTNTGILMQGFEKMISGMYLGDIVRRVIHRMSLESDIFGPVSSKLSVQFVLRYVLLSPPLPFKYCIHLGSWF